MTLSYSPAQPEDIDQIYLFCKELIQTYEQLDSIFDELTANVPREDLEVLGFWEWREGLLAGGFPEERLYVAHDLADALAYVRALPAAERIVLLENDLPDNF